MGGVQLVELPVHDSPSLQFFLGELNTRNGIPAAAGENNYTGIKEKRPVQMYSENSLLKGHGEISKVLSPFAVDVVLETLTESKINTGQDHFNSWLCIHTGCADVPGDRRPTQSRTSGHGWHTCPSLKSSLGTRVHYTFLRKEKNE